MKIGVLDNEFWDGMAHRTKLVCLQTATGSRDRSGFPPRPIAEVTLIVLTFSGPSGNFVGVGLPMQCARGVAGETVPDWFTGGDMLAAGGFCYRMLGWPTGDRLRVAKIPRRLRVPPTGSSRSRIGSIIRAACLPSGSPKRERGVSGSHRDGAGLVRPRTLKGLVAPAPQNPSRPQM